MSYTRHVDVNGALYLWEDNIYKAPPSRFVIPPSPTGRNLHHNLDGSPFLFTNSEQAPLAITIPRPMPGVFEGTPVVFSQQEVDNIIFAEARRPPDVQPSPPPTPVVPPAPPGPRDVRPSGFSQAFLPPLSAQREPRPPFFTPGGGVPAHVPPPPRVPAPPSQGPNGVLTPLPGAGFPQQPPTQTPPMLPPPGGFQAPGPGTSPPVPVTEERSLLNQVLTALVLTSPAWGTYLYQNRRMLMRGLR